MDAEKLRTELQYKAVRSSGPGGQNVNKVASKVVVTFDVVASNALDEEEKGRLREKLASRLTSAHVLMIAADDDRSQLTNKEIATRRLLELIRKALLVPKKRKPTKVPRAVIEKRIKAKRTTSEIKRNRRRPEF